MRHQFVMLAERFRNRTSVGKEPARTLAPVLDDASGPAPGPGATRIETLLTPTWKAFCWCGWESQPVGRRHFAEIRLSRHQDRLGHKPRARR
ncbi:MAG TPA: hypothetical protein VFF67_10350 [Thermoplasmata archaeon]|nr:hypothetical protein [Thermoplasmata archaeon]